MLILIKTLVIVMVKRMMIMVVMMENFLTMKIVECSDHRFISKAIFSNKTIIITIIIMIQLQTR